MVMPLRVAPSLRSLLRQRGNHHTLLHAAQLLLVPTHVATHVATHEARRSLGKRCCGLSSSLCPLAHTSAALCSFALRHSLCVGAWVLLCLSPLQATTMLVAKAVSPPMDKQVGANVSTLPELTREPATASNAKDAVADPAEIRGSPPQRDEGHENTHLTTADITHGIMTKQVRALPVAAAPWRGPSQRPRPRCRRALPSHARGVDARWPHLNALRLRPPPPSGVLLSSDGLTHARACAHGVVLVRSQSPSRSYYSHIIHSFAWLFGIADGAVEIPTLPYQRHEGIKHEAAGAPAPALSPNVSGSGLLPRVHACIACSCGMHRSGRGARSGAHVCGVEAQGPCLHPPHLRCRRPCPATSALATAAEAEATRPLACSRAALGTHSCCFPW